ADLSRREPGLVLLHRLAAGGGPQLHPRGGREIPLRPRLDPGSAARLLDVEHAPSPRDHHGALGDLGHRPRVHRYDDRRRDAVWDAWPRPAIVPPRDAAESGHPTVQGTVQRGPPADRPDRDGEHARRGDARVLRHPPDPRRAGRWAATRLGHRWDVGLGGRLAPVAAADAEQGGATGDVGRAKGLSGRSPSVYGFWLRSFAIRAKAFRRRTIRTRRMAASRSAMPPL